MEWRRDSLTAKAQVLGAPGHAARTPALWRDRGMEGRPFGAPLRTPAGGAAPRTSASPAAMPAHTKPLSH